MLQLSPTTIPRQKKMTLESDTIAGATIELLEARLRRLTYLLGGATDWTGVPTTPEKPATLDETVSRRLAHLERELETLSRSVPAVRDIIQLRTCHAPSIVYACPKPNWTWDYSRCVSAKATLKPLLTTHFPRRSFPRPLPKYPRPRNPRRPLHPHARLHRPLLRYCVPRNLVPTHLAPRLARPRPGEFCQADRIATAA